MNFVVVALKSLYEVSTKDADTYEIELMRQKKGVGEAMLKRFRDASVDHDETKP